MKYVSYSATPQKCINLSMLSEQWEIVDISEVEWGIINEIHILGNKKSEEDFPIDSSYFGGYCNKEKNIFIYLCDSHITDLKWLEELELCVKILDIRFTDIEKFDLFNFSEVTRLCMSDNKKLENIVNIDNLRNLRELNFNYTGIDYIPNLDIFPNLHSLNIKGTKINEIKVDIHINSLEYLDISKTNITNTNFLSCFPRVKRVALTSLDLVKIEGVESLSIIESINCSETSITDCKELFKLKSLRSLNISYTDVSSLDGIEQLENLRSLILDGLNIEEIPQGIMKLNNLNKLRLNDMRLKTLPEEILDLNLEFSVEKKGFGIGLINTTIEDMDMDIFKQPREIVVAWFENRKRNQVYEEGELNEVKVVFLGDGGAGKSLSIDRLINKCEFSYDFSGEATPGISIRDCYYNINEKNILVHYWDFGGQEIMHSMHRMFLTKRTLYIVFVNARDNTQDERARYWLHNIKSFADNSPVIIVLNQIDQNPSASVNESSLKKLYPAIKRIVRSSAINFSKEEFQKSIERNILEEIEQMGVTKEMFLGSWHKLKYKLQSMEDNYINQARFMEICDQCDVDNNEIVRKILLEWFADLGISFCYRDSRNLSEYMVLRPEWITNAIYIVLFNGRDYATNGVISHKDIFDLLTGKSKAYRVYSNILYSINEVEYVLGVIRKFKLSYRLDDELEFIPMLCDRNEPNISEEFYGRNDILEFVLEYQYLPLNVLHRLMVEMRNDLNREYVWLTGTLFESSEMGYRALVKAEDNRIYIYIEANKALFQASSYLGFLRKNIDSINKSLGLVASEKIVYKDGEQREYFEYRTIISSYEYGNKSMFSVNLNRNIEIMDILLQIGNYENDIRRCLQKDLIDACGMLQANKLTWNATEDERNTYIRDILRSKKYMISDQTLTGVSAGGKKAGELDLEVFEDECKPLSLIEALIINAYNNSQKQYWSEHLCKLLDNYNQIGLPELYLLSYVECGKDEFKELWVNYMTYVRLYSCGNYYIQESKEMEIEESFYIRGIECKYDRYGMPTRVYCIFMRIGA